MPAEERKQQRDGIRLGRTGQRPYWVFLLAILLRALHQLGAAVFLASYLLEAVPEPPGVAVAAASVSGVALFLAEWLRHRECYRELSGLATLAKLALLGLALHGLLPAAATVVTAFILASLAAHAPKEYRHRLLY